MTAIQLTPEAQEKAQVLLSQESDGKAGLRVAIVGGGCNGLQYKIGWDDPTERDVVHTYENGLLTMVDQFSAAQLEGSTLEFHDTLEQQGFEVVNPNSTGSCGCGKSFCT